MDKISPSDNSVTKQSPAQGYACIHLFLKQESVLALCWLSAGNTGQVFRAAIRQSPTERSRVHRPLGSLEHLWNKVYVGGGGITVLLGNKVLRFDMQNDDPKKVNINCS